MSKELIDHCDHVRCITNFICNNMGIEGFDRECLLRAAEIHDIGKSYIPVDILNAERGLSKSEMEIVNMHTVFGYVKCVEHGENPLVSQLVLLHHGIHKCNSLFKTPKDYTSLCSIKAMSLYSVLVAADIYSAMVMKRVYKEACSSNAALNVIYENEEIPNRVVNVLSKM